MSNALTSDEEEEEVSMLCSWWQSVRLVAAIVILLAAVALLACASTASTTMSTTLWTRQDIERFVDRWNAKDGVASIVLSDYFCEFAIANPGTFLDVMAENKAVFDSWLADLAKLSFTDRGGCLDRGCFRESMIRSIDGVQGSGRTEAIRLALAERLRTISVRRVE